MEWDITWNDGPYTVNLSWYGSEGWMRYEFLVNDRVLFSGSDYRPSPLYDRDNDIVMSLLAFLTLRPGDTDEEYFAEYTAEQLAWANSWECEALSAIVWDHWKDAR